MWDGGFMRAKKNYSGFGYDAYTPKPMSMDDLWKECVRAVSHVFTGLNLDETDDGLKDDAMTHARRFYQIHYYDLDQTLIAMQRFVATHILDHKRRYWRWYDAAIGVMARSEKGLA